MKLLSIVVDLDTLQVIVTDRVTYNTDHELRLVYTRITPAFEIRLYIYRAGGISESK